MTSNLEARLQYLETREEANTRDNVRLKTENADLQNKMFDLMQENSKAMKKLMEIETAFQKMGSDLKNVFGFRENIDRHLTSLESKVTNVKDTEDRVSSLETLVNEMRVDILTNSRSVSEKLEDLRRQRNSTLCSSEVELRLKDVEVGTRQAIKDRLEPLERNMSCCQKNIEVKLEQFEKDIIGPQKKVEIALEQVKKDICDCQKDFKNKIEQVKKDISGGQKDFINRLEQVKKNAGYSQSSVNYRLEKLENVVSGPQKDVKDNRLEQIEKGMRDSQKTVNDRLGKVESSSQESKRVCQTLTNKMKLVERKAQETQNSVGTLTETQNLISQNVTRVWLEPSKALETGVTTKLDKCTELDINNGLFNKASGCLEPSIGGKYLVNVAFCQRNEGRMKVFLKRIQTDAEESHYIGQTSKSAHVCSVMNILHLNKGAKVWLATQQDEGDAEIHWCFLSSFLISPSPA